MAYYGQCGSCAYYCGSKNPSIAGECNIKQIEVYPGRSAEDCPYYRLDDNN